MNDNEQEFIEDDVSILDYLLPLVRWRWLIFYGTLAMAILGVIFALAKSPYYTATAYVMPRGALGETDELSALAGSQGKDWRSVRSAGDMTKYFSVAMKSRPLMESMLQRSFKTAEGADAPLLKLVGGDRPGDQLARAVEALRKAFEVGSGGGKILTVSFSADEPQLAADVANALLEEYGNLPRRSQRATSDMELIKNRLEEVRQNLENKEREIAEAKSKALDSGQPDAIQRRTALEREVRLLESLYGDLNAEYAKAEVRMIQSRQQASGEIDVLDYAEPPISRTGPNRSKIVLVFAFLGVVLTSGAAFGIEFFQNARRVLSTHPFWALLKGARKDLVVMGGVAAAVFLLLVLYRLIR